MIVSKTPLRISFVGGGSDLSSYYEHVDFGRVISATIDKYIYINVHKRYDDLIRASYSKTEIVDNIEDLNHELIRESLKLMHLQSGIEITSISDLTAYGTGLGSSSAYTAGVLNALARLKNLQYSRYNLANDTCAVEIDRCHHPIGRQDQFACVFGGINEITFTKKQTDLTPVNIKTDTILNFSNNLMLFDTGIKRKSSQVLKNQKESYKSKNFKLTNKLVQLTKPFKNSLVNNDLDLTGKILDESWKLKRGIVAGITSNNIDDMYDSAKSAGAIGGKLCGAGGGGFLLFYVKDEHKESVRRKLSGLKELSFNLEHEGSKIL